MLDQFTYLTAHEAFNARHTDDPAFEPRTRPLHVFNQPADLTWGLHPLGWHFYGHDMPGRGDYDYWRAPADTRGHYLLRIPRTLDRDLHAHLIEAHHRHAGPIWTVTATTRTELDQALAAFDVIARDPDALQVFTALQI